MNSGDTFSALVIFMVAGVFVGVIFNTLYLFVKLTKNNVIVILASDFLGTVLAGLTFYVISFKYFYGGLNFYFFICFFAGILFEIIFIKKLFANSVKDVYNKIKKNRQTEER